jgi:hypothetical protein
MRAQQEYLSIGSEAAGFFRPAVVHCSEVSIRNDITSNMNRRAMFRRTRRNRLRGRPARWQNRAKSKRKDRFSPTMTSKIDSHLKEINFVKSTLPIFKIILETAIFDIHALVNPKVKKHKWLYQKGPQFDFENTKSYVRYRDGYKCQICKGKSKDEMLHVHHIIFKSNNGSNLPSNLITLCRSCHDKLHSGKIPNMLSNSNIPKTPKHATQMNSIRIQLLKRIPDAVESFGYITKMNRLALALPKEHYFDAVAVASRGRLISLKTRDLFIKRSQAKWEYKLTEGAHSQIKINFGKKMGFLARDKVLFKGKEHFVQTRRADGCITLMNIDCKYTTSTKHWAKLKRISARTSLMVGKKILNVIRNKK